MSLGNLPLFSALSQKLTWLGQRQQVLAQNVANADTPGYTPKDVKEPDFLALVKQAAEGNGEPAAPAAFEIEDYPDTYETNLNGNSVVLEQQLFKVAQTGTNYQLMTSLYRKHVDMLKLALGRGSGG